MPVKTKPVPMEDSDRAFMQKLYQSHKGLMLYAASKYTDDPQDREDIVQETVYRLMKNISVLRDIPCCNLKRYIVLTVRSVFMDMQKKRDIAMLSLDDERLGAVLHHALLQEDGFSELSAKLDIWRLQKELPERDWALLEGKYIQQLPDEQLSQRTGIAADSIRMLLSRARKKAKEILTGSIQKGGGQYE